MAIVKETQQKRFIIARMEKGEDILKILEKIAEEYNIKSGQLSLIGAVAKIKLGYFDVENNTYKDFVVEEDLEVVSCVGNIATLTDGTPIIHAHLIAADSDGRCYGGHLMEGCIVSVTIEVSIIEAEGIFHRGKDERTGLNLLQLKE